MQGDKDGLNRRTKSRIFSQDSIVKRTNWEHHHQDEESLSIINYDRNLLSFVLTLASCILKEWHRFKIDDILLGVGGIESLPRISELTLLEHPSWVWNI